MGCCKSKEGAKSSTGQDPYLVDEHDKIDATSKRKLHDERAVEDFESGELDDFEMHITGGTSRRASTNNFILSRVQSERSMDSVAGHRLIPILELLDPSQEQMRFFKVWAKMIYNEVLPLCEEKGQLTIISTDLSYMEVRVTAVTDALLNLMRDFLLACDVPLRQFEAIEKLVEELEPERLTIWCKLKHIGRRKPSVDTGISIQKELVWALADVLMPPVDDQDSLRNYALKQNYMPNLYGSSVLPLEPEKHLAFEVTTEDTHVSQKQLFVAAFLFFKSLGFTKPEDKVDRLLGACSSGRFLISVLMGPKGLTRVTMSVIEPTLQVAEELAETLNVKYRREVIEEIQTRLEGEADVLDYVGDSRGYSVMLGFIA